MAEPRLNRVDDAVLQVVPTPVETTADFPLGLDYLDQGDARTNPYTPAQIPVLGAVDTSPNGNTILRVGHTHFGGTGTWHQTEHLVLTPAETETLIAALTSTRTPVEGDYDGSMGIVAVAGCGCACTSGGFCGGCGHAGCGRR